MKNRIMIIVSCTLLLMAAGCKNKEPKTLLGNEQQPAWTVISDHDYSSSMTAVVEVDMSLSYPKLASQWQLNDGDVMAAFMDGQCVGVTSPSDGLFFLYIAHPSNSTTDGIVTLHYYSAAVKNIFVAKEPFNFSSDTRMGSISEPYKPAFYLKSKD